MRLQVLGWLTLLTAEEARIGSAGEGRVAGAVCCIPLWYGIVRCCIAYLCIVRYCRFIGTFQTCFIEEGINQSIGVCRQAGGSGEGMRIHSVLGLLLSTCYISPTRG